ncbi:hypothetical protein IW261DRAFT_1484075 [Armillaria novae-zelandiae]|uniref:F-box domain-containing protein n=1 Tax=Armillaria novae-zelandiae TaxID=153914 RepID=A0AA39P554_9AGAR|nr:hypothetical protein IW261DRAFT_1484075 [Armillaria novae-zelandiae]
MTSTNKMQGTSAINLLPDELLLGIFALGTIDTDGANFSFLVAAVCQYWRSLAINDARLWTSLTITPSREVPSLSSDGQRDPRAIFPREALTLERSANKDIDFDILPCWPSSKSFTDAHFTVLSALLAEHAHRIRSFKVQAAKWREIICLCKRLPFTNMPRLQIWNMMTISDLTYRDEYNETHPVDALSVLAYAFYSDSEHVSIQELKRSGTLLYPALTDVTISGVPVAWTYFSASNLRKLVLTKYPLENRLLMQTLHGILSNSKDTLETLTLKWVIAAEVEWADNHLLLRRLTLPRIKEIEIGYMHAQEACRILQTFDLPALRNLRLEGLIDYEVDSSMIFIDVMKYLPVEQLEELALLSIRFPLGDLPNHDLVKDGSIAEESLPLLLQFVRRLVHVHTLVLSHCSDALLKYMNYTKGDTINMAGLKKLSIWENTKDPEIGIVPFLRERVEMGTVDGQYVGPVIEDMRLVMHLSIGNEYLKVAEHTTCHLSCLPPTRALT